MNQADFNEAVAVEYHVRKNGACLYAMGGKLYVYGRRKITPALAARCKRLHHILMQLLIVRAMNDYDYP